MEMRDETIARWIEEEKTAATSNSRNNNECTQDKLYICFL